MLNVPQMEMTEINGTRLELFDGGNPDGEPLVYVHGGGSIEFQAAAHQPALADRFRLIYLHRRGYAGSDSPIPPVSISDYAADFRALLLALGIERAHFAGQSSGGVILLQYILEHPSTVQSAALFEPALPSVLANEPGFHATMERAGSLYEQDDKAGAVDAFYSEVCGDDYRGKIDAHLPEGWFDQLTNEVDTIVLHESEALNAWSFTASDAARIHQPVLNVSGADTTPYLRRCHETIASWIPHSESVILRATTHCMFETNSRLIAEHLVAFCSRYPIAQSGPTA